MRVKINFRNQEYVLGCTEFRVYILNQKSLLVKLCSLNFVQSIFLRINIKKKAMGEVFVNRARRQFLDTCKTSPWGNWLYIQELLHYANFVDDLVPNFLELPSCPPHVMTSHQLLQFAYVHVTATCVDYVWDDRPPELQMPDRMKRMKL